MKIIILLTTYVFLITNVVFGQLYVTSTTTPCTCNGDCNATATAIPNGGTAPYTYLWSNDQTTQTANGLCPGIYIVTISDAAGDKASAISIIYQPSPIHIDLTVIPGSCYNCCDGSVIANTTLGTPPYSYQWSCTNPNQNNDTAIGICSGTCIVTITDANGCVGGDTSVWNFSVELIDASSPISIYPNPLTNKLNINANSNFINKISIFSIIGKNVFNANIIDKEASFNIGFLDNGIYYIYFYSETDMKIQKIIKNAP